MAPRQRSVKAVALPVQEGVAQLPVRAARDRRLPTRRSLIVGLALLLAAVGAYVLARETSAFAVRSVEVQGVGPPLATRVRRALAPLRGESLVSLDRGDAARRVLALPEVAGVSVDRAFPHTLRVTVRAERPIAVLRQADLAWLASADGRVLRQLTARPYPKLPRIWVPRSGDVLVGATLQGAQADALHALAPLAGIRFPLPVRAARVDEHGLVLVLGPGLDIRLGDSTDLRLKLAVAARIVRAAPGAHYVDVTVPDRAVAG